MPGAPPKYKPSKNGTPTVAALASVKSIPLDYLIGRGLRDVEGGVEVPYFDAAGNEMFARRRVTTTGKNKTIQPSGVPLAAYGAERLDRVRTTGVLFVVEGESDCWALDNSGLAALGCPGANTFAVIQSEHLEDVHALYIQVEPDDAGEKFLAGVKARLLALGFAGKVHELRMPDGIKDVADLHADNPALFLMRLQRAITTAPAVELSPRSLGNGKVDEPASRPLVNYEEKEIVQGDDKKTIMCGLSAPEIGRRLFEVTDSWPKRVGDRLFIVEKEKPLWLESHDAFFAWYARRFGWSNGNAICWRKGNSMVTRPEFFALLRQVAERFEGVESLPHHPPIPGLYYLNDPLPRARGQAFKRLLSYFTPSSERDGDLLAALFLTPLWGGPPGQRPAFLIQGDADDPQGGRGVGKSKLGQAVGRVFGGHIEVRPSEDIDKVITRLLSPTGADKRICLLDNLKTLKLSHAELEGLITTNVISGKQMYVGEGSRPNLLTWILTINGASLSRDLAQRCIPIQLKRPRHLPTWEAEVWAYIDEHRREIIADAVAELQRITPPLTRFSRWSAWEAGVLSRVSIPIEAQQLIAARQDAIDDDKAEADIVREGFVAELIRRKYDPDTVGVLIPSLMVAQIVNAATGERHATNKASAYLRTLAIQELRKSDRSDIRGWAWQGCNSDPTIPLVPLIQPFDDGPSPY